VVERFVSGCRARLRRVYCPENASREKRTTRDGGDTVFQFGPLCYATVAVDLVALASIVVFPDLESLRSAFPNMPAEIVKHDMAYSAMLTFLPAGLLGVVVASLIAALMSTISTHLNWGASYVVNDFYRRFVKTNPTERQLVWVGKATVVGLMVLAATLALFLSNALQAFHILLQIGAGTGLLFLLRWFWWRISAASEIAAMIVSFTVALYFEFIHTHLGFAKLIVGWILVTILTKPTDQETLLKFYRKVHPGGPGWKHILETARRSGEDVEAYLAQKWDVPNGLLAVFLGILLVYSALFATGFWLYSNVAPALVTTVVATLSAFLLIKLWGKVQ